MQHVVTPVTPDEGTHTRSHDLPRSVVAAPIVKTAGLATPTIDEEVNVSQGSPDSDVRKATTIGVDNFYESRISC